MCLRVPQSRWGKIKRWTFIHDKPGFLIGRRIILIDRYLFSKNTPLSFNEAAIYSQRFVGYRGSVRMSL